MDDTKIINNLQLIHNGQPIDGRALRSLKRGGYVDSSGLLTSWGFRKLGVYKHMPQLPLADIASFKDQHALIVEEMYRSCDCCHSHSMEFSENYTISVEKLAEHYNNYATLVNICVKEHCWDHQLDDMVDRGWAPQSIQTQMLRLAQDRIEFAHFHYTRHIMRHLMIGIIGGKTEMHDSTSYKYSITDSVNEIKDMISDGPAKYIINVEVNR